MWSSWLSGVRPKTAHHAFYVTKSDRCRNAIFLWVCFFNRYKCKINSLDWEDHFSRNFYREKIRRYTTSYLKHFVPNQTWYLPTRYIYRVSRNIGKMHTPTYFGQQYDKVSPKSIKQESVLSQYKLKGPLVWKAIRGPLLWVTFVSLYQLRRKAKVLFESHKMSHTGVAWPQASLLFGSCIFILCCHEEVAYVPSIKPSITTILAKLPFFK